MIGSQSKRSSSGDRWLLNFIRVVFDDLGVAAGLYPNQSGAWDMDKKKFVEYWEKMENGLGSDGEVSQRRRNLR